MPLASTESTRDHRSTHLRTTDRHGQRNNLVCSQQDHGMGSQSASITRMQRQAHTHTHKRDETICIFVYDTCDTPMPMTHQCTARTAFFANDNSLPTTPVRLNKCTIVRPYSTGIHSIAYCNHTSLKAKSKLSDRRSKIHVFLTQPLP